MTDGGSQALAMEHEAQAKATQILPRARTAQMGRSLHAKRAFNVKDVTVVLV